VKLDMPAPNPIPPTVIPETVELAVDFDGTVTWNGAPVDRATMDSYFADAATKNPQPGKPSKYVMFDLEDVDGTIRCILWPDGFAEMGQLVQADAILMAREFLREPYWPLRAAQELRQSVSWPVQYLRAAPGDAHARVPVDLEKLKSCFEQQHAIPERR